MFGNLQRVKQVMDTIKSSKNPQMMLQNMLVQNPNYKQIMDYVKQNGGDPKACFYKMAQEKGVNPDDILQYLK